MAVVLLMPVLLLAVMIVGVKSMALTSRGHKKKFKIKSGKKKKTAFKKLLLGLGFCKD